MKLIGNYQVTQSGTILNKHGKQLKERLTLYGDTKHYTTANKLVYEHFGGYEPITLEGEIFKHYNNKYSISNIGRVWNRYTGKHIKPISRKSGTQIFYASRSERVYIAKEIAKLFINNPNNSTEIEHINGDRKDTRACNLRWKPIKTKKIKEVLKPLEGEEFRTIKGYENYRVSNKGRVWSDKTNKMLRPRLGNRGYYDIALKNNSKSKRFYVHRLVALTFIPNPENKPQVNHIDLNRTNSNVENLEWCTDQENKDHAASLRGFSYKKKSKS